MDVVPEVASADHALAVLAAPRYGVFVPSDAHAVGITPRGLSRRCQKGVVRRLHQGVYAMAAVPPSPHQTLLAACRWAGAGSAASHEAAAALWKLDGFEALRPVISTPRRLRSDRVRSHRVDPIPAGEIVEIDGIPVTKIERTLLDLAGAVDVNTLEDALDSALRRRLTTINRLEMRVRGSAGKTGVRKLRSLLAERDHEGHPTESRFESRLQRLLLDAGLPAVRQHKIWDGGEFVARVDFCFPESKVIVEADSYRWHSSRRAWQRDRERRNRLTSMGWVVIQVTWDDVIKRPTRTVERLRSLIQPRLPI